MPAIRSDTAFSRVYRGNQPRIGRYFATVKRGFRRETGIDGHSSSDILLASMRSNRETNEHHSALATSQPRACLNGESHGAPVSESRVILSSPRARLSLKARYKNSCEETSLIPPINSRWFHITCAVDNLIKTIIPHGRQEP